MSEPRHSVSFLNNDISYYSFDIIGHGFDSFRSKCRRYPFMVYYAVNNHLYWVGNKEEARKRAGYNKDMDTKVRSDMFQNYTQCKNDFVNEERKSNQFLRI